MKKLPFLLSLSVLFLGLNAFVASNPTKVAVDIQQSTIVWKGYKVTGMHEGNISLKSGELEMDNGQLVGGSFVVDMTSITCTDLDGKWGDKLVEHLKNEDFFSVDQYATATLDITDVKMNAADKYTVTADLTIKDVKESVMFDVVMTKENGKTMASATVKVDRTKYDIRYGSASFFNDLGDKAINNDFELMVNIVM